MSSGTHDALERRLLAEHAAAYPTGAPRGFFAAHRLALASVGLGLAAAAACQVPLDYEREFGASVTCELPRESWPEGQVDAIAKDLAERLGGPTNWPCERTMTAGRRGRFVSSCGAARPTRRR
jgi:hypothetical protein